MIFLSKWVICRFHVNLPGCTLSPTIMLQWKSLRRFLFEGNDPIGGIHPFCNWTMLKVYSVGRLVIGIFFEKMDTETLGDSNQEKFWVAQASTESKWLDFPSFPRCGCCFHRWFPSWFCGSLPGLWILAETAGKPAGFSTGVFFLAWEIPRWYSGTAPGGSFFHRFLWFNESSLRSNGVSHSLFLHPFMGLTPLKTNMELESEGFQKESPFPGVHFQVPCEFSGGCT